MVGDRKTIYYAPFDHHLNANSLITPGANCHVVRSVILSATNCESSVFSLFSINVIFLQLMSAKERGGWNGNI